MPSFLRALIVFALLCGGTAGGFLLSSHLLGRYTETGALESVNLIISFLVTITAIVIGMLINATKSFIDATQGHWAMFAGKLIRLDQTLCNYGSESEPMRRQLQSFTAAGIVNFWRADAVPTGVNYPDVRKLPKGDARQVLSDLLNRIELGIIELKPTDPLRERLAADCFDQYREFARARLSLLFAPQNPLPAPFLRMLVAWLTLLFICFGLRAPADSLVILMIALAAATLSSMMFVVMDSVDPYQGLYNISSKNMHQALDAMIRHNSSVNVGTGSPAASDECANRAHKADETDSAVSVFG
ncbi:MULTISPECIES: hypothetical protein [unclassified Mycolicibacterium]|uniref:bestrophin-like domain n=1 Tax=unclassified Mycolicibacterium TaxID=2636767 RepID=UPI0012DBDAEF|nr:MULTISPECIES: hypothetical protein [unclassified Mycolicibacterium]MUL85595.1 hypothetical protein [Mycolicibacterium sp. CBMA 329]MUL88641.1 hypothetical protein [Mycolicibacterium sp. CBMA 331]MUM02064.1 hypothetical protein [Mycolicibacterium sp. CBMA 334]MUM26965.1 hypothetical protein [Mycolicibacterium sp. CBMA 295]MUM40288.1 hypothetical protein [Mycolicibacterium sp. CBMA 247]